VNNSRFSWTVVCLAATAACLVVAPRVAGAALVLGIEGDGSCTPGEHFVDLVFTETGGPDNESLFSYDLSLTLEPVSGPAGGVSFTGAAVPPDHFVLDVPSGAIFRVGRLTPDSLLINVASNEDPADITTGSKAARIFYTIGALPPDGYRIAFDPAETNFASIDPDRPLDIPVDVSDAGLIICPEPGGGFALVVAGFFVMRRRWRTPDCARSPQPRAR
jgi:hypothetical protein